MHPDLQIRPATTAASHLRRQNPEHFVRLLEAHLSALIDSRDTPGWKVNPAYHPDVTAFIQAYSNNSGFVKRARALQQNRAEFYARAISPAASRPTTLHGPRPTVLQALPVAMPVGRALPVAIPIPMAIPVDP
jgi:hypothetical protein